MEKMIWWLDLPFQPMGSRFNVFFKFCFPSMNEMNGKKHLNNFFKLHSLRRKWLSLGRSQNGSPNHVPPMKRGLHCLEDHLCDCLTRKYKGYLLSKSNIFYNIEKLWKCRYLKWSCILHLRLWTKSHDKKIVKIKFSKSPSPLASLGD